MMHVWDWECTEWVNLETIVSLWLNIFFDCIINHHFWGKKITHFRGENLG